jgi:hypothetical protein
MYWDLNNDVTTGADPAVVNDGGGCSGDDSRDDDDDCDGSGYSAAGERRFSCRQDLGYVSVDQGTRSDRTVDCWCGREAGNSTADLSSCNLIILHFAG